MREPGHRSSTHAPGDTLCSSLPPPVPPRLCRSTAALRPLVEVVVLLIVAAALAVVWLLGVVAFHITAFAIHLLLIIAVIVVIAHFVTRGRARA